MAPLQGWGYVCISARPREALSLGWYIAPLQGFNVYRALQGFNVSYTHTTRRVTQKLLHPALMHGAVTVLDS
jgi:hypothetical protein